MIKIHLGCNGSIYGVIPGINGPHVWGPAEEWINVDVNFDPELLTRPHADELVHGYPRAFTCDFRRLPFPDDFADVAYSHHSF